LPPEPAAFAIWVPPVDFQAFGKRTSSPPGRKSCRHRENLPELLQIFRAGDVRLELRDELVLVLGSPDGIIVDDGHGVQRHQTLGRSGLGVGGHPEGIVLGIQVLKKDNPQASLMFGGSTDNYIAASSQGLLEAYQSPELSNRWAIMIIS